MRISLIICMINLDLNQHFINFSPKLLKVISMENWLCQINLPKPQEP